MFSQPLFLNGLLVGQVARSRNDEQFQLLCESIEIVQRLTLMNSVIIFTVTQFSTEINFSKMCPVQLAK